MTIFLLIITLLSVFAMGSLFIISVTMDDDTEDKGAKKVAFCFLVAMTIFFVIAFTFLIDSNKRYYEEKEYSLTEYDMNKKTIVTEGNNSAKTDTVYFFVRKSNN